MTNPVNTQRVLTLGAEHHKLRKADGSPRKRMITERIEDGLTDAIHKLSMNRFKDVPNENKEFATWAGHAVYEISNFFSNLFGRGGVDVNEAITEDHSARLKREARTRAKTLVRQLLTAIKSNNLVVDGGFGAAHARKINDETSNTFVTQLLDEVNGNESYLRDILSDLKSVSLQKDGFEGEVIGKIECHKDPEIALNKTLFDSFATKVFTTSVFTTSTGRAVAETLAASKTMPTIDSIQEILRTHADSLNLDVSGSLDELATSLMEDATAGYNAGIQGAVDSPVPSESTPDSADSEQVEASSTNSSSPMFAAGQAAARAQLEAMGALVKERETYLDSSSIVTAVEEHVAKVEKEVQKAIATYEKKVDALRVALHDEYLAIRDQIQLAAPDRDIGDAATQPLETITDKSKINPLYKPFKEIFPRFTEEEISLARRQVRGGYERRGKNPPEEAYKEVVKAKKALEEADTKQESLEVLIKSVAHTQATEARRAHLQLIESATKVSEQSGKSVPKLLEKVKGTLDSKYIDEQDVSVKEIESQLARELGDPGEGKPSEFFRVAAQKLVLEHIAMDQTVKLAGLNAKCPLEFPGPSTGDDSSRSIARIIDVHYGSQHVFQAKRRIPEWTGYGRECEKFKKSLLDTFGDPEKGNKAHPMNVLSSLVFDEAKGALGNLEKQDKYFRDTMAAYNRRVEEEGIDPCHGEHILFNDTAKGFVREALKKLADKLIEVQSAKDESPAVEHDDASSVSSAPAAPAAPAEGDDPFAGVLVATRADPFNARVKALVDPSQARSE